MTLRDGLKTLHLALWDEGRRKLISFGELPAIADRGRAFVTSPVKARVLGMAGLWAPHPCWRLAEETI